MERQGPSREPAGMPGRMPGRCHLSQPAGPAPANRQLNLHVHLHPQQQQQQRQSLPPGVRSRRSAAHSDTPQHRYRSSGGTRTCSTRSLDEYCCSRYSTAMYSPGGTGGGTVVAEGRGNETARASGNQSGCGQLVPAASSWARLGTSSRAGGTATCCRSRWQDPPWASLKPFLLPLMIRSQTPKPQP